MLLVNKENLRVITEDIDESFIRIIAKKRIEPNKDWWKDEVLIPVFPKDNISDLKKFLKMKLG